MMPLSWPELHVRIRDSRDHFPGFTEMLFAAERGLDMPLDADDALDMMLDRYRKDPLASSDAAIAWAERLVPDARLQFRNEAPGGGWSATVTHGEAGVEAHACARTLPFALIKAAIELRVGLDRISAPDPG